MKLVKIVSSIESAEVLKDPIRRQILEFLAEVEMTEAEMAKKLEFTQASISYHMKELSRAGLVEIARTELESHGILQKFYRASARLIMVDYEKMPYSIRRYTLALYAERIRGALAALALRNPKAKLTREEVELLSDALARQVVSVARQIGTVPEDLSRESLIQKIYSAALAKVAAMPEGQVLQAMLKMPLARKK